MPLGSTRVPLEAACACDSVSRIEVDAFRTACAAPIARPAKTCRMKGDTVPGFDAMPAGGRGEAGPRHWRWLELALLGAGLALLAVYLAARLDSAIGKRLAVRRFERVRPPAGTAAMTRRSISTKTASSMRR